MGFGRRRNAHDISVNRPTDNAHGDDWSHGTKNSACRSGSAV